MAACSDGGQGIAAAVREMLGSGGLGEGGGEAQNGLLDSVDALVVARINGRCGSFSIVYCHRPNGVQYYMYTKQARTRARFQYFILYTSRLVPRC